MKTLAVWLPTLVAVIVLASLIDATWWQAILVGGGFAIIAGLAEKLIFESSA